MSKGPAMRCPHCRQSASIRHSVEMTPLYREVTYQCRNPICGHVWISGLEALRTLSPSGTPDAEIPLPLSRHINISLLQVQLTLALEN